MDMSTDSEGDLETPQAGGLAGGANALSATFAAPSIDDQNALGGASAEDVQATLDFKKKKAFMTRKTTIS